MKFALFAGCKIPYFVPQYEAASRIVLRECGVELVDIEFNCCGYPVHHLDFNAFVLSSARNLALAEKQGLNVLTPCKCCFGSLKKVEHLLKERDSLREEINATLKEEELKYEGVSEAKHLLSVLFHDVGLEALREKVIRPYQGLKIATHYGCHALRPGNVTQFDDPVAPTKFDQLVEITGAESVDWTMKLQCCGNPLWGKNDALSKDLTEKKLVDGKQAGAHYLCVACTYCQIQFDMVQKMIISERGDALTLPSILYPQLLGLSMGIEGEKLGITMNELNLDGLMTYLS
jgi:heterodisulfide reductase subunit B